MKLIKDEIKMKLIKYNYYRKEVVILDSVYINFNGNTCLFTNLEY